MKRRIVLQRVFVSMLIGILMLMGCTSEIVTPTTPFKDIVETEVAEMYKPKRTVCPASNTDLDIVVDPGWIKNPPGSVTIQFTITNNDTETKVYEKSDGPVIDIVIPSGYSGDVDARSGPGTPRPTATIFRWSDLQSPSQIPHRLEFKPGESRQIKMIYTSQILSGTESVEGRLWHYSQYDTCHTSFQLGPFIR